MPLKITQVSHTYTTNGTSMVQALNQVSFDLFPGEVCGLYGPPGSGKSTLLHLVAGLLPLQSGSITVSEGIIPSNQPGYRQVGLVSQFPERQLFARSVWEDVAFAAQNQGIQGAALEEKVQKAMELAGLDYCRFKDRRPLALSGGERRKVALAGVLAISPEYLLLDEPTAGLDFDARNILYETIHTLSQTGLGILLVSHRPQDLLETAERIIILEFGQLILDAPVMKAIQYLEQEENTLQPVSPSRDLMYRLQQAGWEIPDNICNPADLVEAIQTNL